MSATANYLHDLARATFPRLEIRQSEDGEAWDVVLALGVRCRTYADGLRLAAWHHDGLREALVADLAADDYSDPWTAP